MIRSASRPAVNAAPAVCGVSITPRWKPTAGHGGIVRGVRAAAGGGIGDCDADARGVGAVRPVPEELRRQRSARPRRAGWQSRPGGHPRVAQRTCPPQGRPARGRAASGTARNGSHATRRPARRTRHAHSPRERVRPLHRPGSGVVRRSVSSAGNDPRHRPNTSSPSDRPPRLRLPPEHRRHPHDE